MGFLRDEGSPWFTTAEERFLASLSERVAHGLRRSLLTTALSGSEVGDATPGVVVLDDRGRVESVSPGAQLWIEQVVEDPAPRSPADSRAVQAVAARARTLGRGTDPLGLAARARVRTRAGSWLLLYATPLSGSAGNLVAVVIQPAPSCEVAPIVALAYGLSEREREVTRLCMEGRPTKEMARLLGVSPYTVQDHLKSIFRKTGVGTRGELVAQIFLEHYVPRWEQPADRVDTWEIR